jgi:hypothetical protein
MPGAVQVPRAAHETSFLQVIRRSLYEMVTNVPVSYSQPDRLAMSY